MLSCFIGLILCGVACWRGTFSLDAIAGPLNTEGSELGSLDIRRAINQPYHFLGEGRQSFAFVSADGKTVLKFFNRKYFQVPWYTFYNLEKETKKRKQREMFYRESYLIAEKFLPKQTGLLYVHLGKTRELPKVRLTDRTNQEFIVDLNEVPFVLQRRGEMLYCALQEIQKSKGDEALLESLQCFLEMIAYRISLGIGDGDHDVEHNFGFLDGKPFHLDPGRLFFSDFSDPSKKDHEWWAATHSLRKWVEEQYPEFVVQFDELVEVISH